MRPSDIGERGEVFDVTGRAADDGVFFKLPVHSFADSTMAWRKFRDEFRAARRLDEAPECN
jgi:hypothetical protein